MVSLYLDTTNHLICGLLDEWGRWVDYQEISLKKSSELLHKTIHRMLLDQKLSVRNIQSLFTITGPGSYTGVRLAEGMARVFDWQNVPVFSCRHFDIPYLLGIKRGAFLAPAFKREIFVYLWDENTVDKKNLSDSQLDPIITLLEQKKYPLFVSHEYDLFSKFKKILTSDLLRKNIGELFSQIKMKKIRNPLYYYRHPEEEFTPPTQLATVFSI